MPEVGPSKRIRRRRDRPFVKGPIPLEWLTAAAQLEGGSPLIVGLAIWHLSGLQRKVDKITVSLAGISKRWGLSRSTVTRALAKLEAASLVRVSHAPGCSPRVGICAPGQS